MRTCRAMSRQRGERQREGVFKAAECAVNGGEKNGVQVKLKLSDRQLRTI